MNYKKLAKKTWHFIWEEDSLLSWVVNVILAFILIKFIVYPLLGFLLGTTHPVVAVVSTSMEHDGSFDDWWASQANCGYPCTQGEYYSNYGITKEEFREFSFKNGFNKGDIMVLYNPKNSEMGDIVVFWSGRANPIIHRVVKEENGTYQTKGDHNVQSIQTSYLDEYSVTPDKFVGKAVAKVPLLGYVKIIFVELLRMVGIA
ncbi:hypothetical protein ACFLZ7_00910 [Nanoarchaeota archaeon]